MKLLAFNGETNIEILARRAYGLSDDADAAKVRLAVDTLREENPHLRDLMRLRKGTPIFVKEVEGLRLRIRSDGENRQTQPFVGTPAVDAMRAALGRAARTAAESAEREAKDALDSVELIDRDPDLEMIAENNEAFAARLGRVTEAAKKRREAVAEQSRRQREQIDLLAKALDELESGARAAQEGPLR